MEEAGNVALAEKIVPEEMPPDKPDEIVQEVISTDEIVPETSVPKESISDEVISAECVSETQTTEPVQVSVDGSQLETENTVELTSVKVNEETGLESQTDETIVDQQTETKVLEENVEPSEIEKLPVDNIITALKYALANKDPEDSDDDDTEDLSSSNADPKQRILWAAEKNEIDAVRSLLDEDPSLVSARDENLYTPLHRACSNNHVEIVQLLLTAGADLGARTDDEWCPLHCACRWDSVEAASLLLQGGADVNAASKGGLTPLHLASANSSGRRTLELLLWHPRVDGNLRAENGDTAYDIAVRTSSTLPRLFEMLDESVNCF